MNIVPMQPYDVVEVSAAYKVRETKRRPARLLLAGWELSDDGKEGGGTNDCVWQDISHSIMSGMLVV